MILGSLVRTPPRRLAHRRPARIATALCIALLALPFGTGRADAYPCGPAAGAQRAALDDCSRPGKHVEDRPRAGDPNVVSLTIFVGVIVAVLLVPLNYSRRGTAEPE